MPLQRTWRSKTWRNAAFVIVALCAAAAAWANRFEPTGSPYFHKNRYTGAQCHRGVECWLPSAGAWPKAPVE
jgi:hypothetical protein